jgi:ElaB/YqjD/DUF883 family membrane-anchored ribosome-binding protein
MEQEKKDELSKTLELLINKIDELTKTIKEEKSSTENNAKKTSKDDSKILEKLTNKIDELTESAKGKKVATEDKVKENPLAYMIGSFIGGLTIGILIRKRENGK